MEIIPRFHCINCGDKLPTHIEVNQGYSDYGSGISRDEVFTLGTNSWHVGIMNENDFDPIYYILEEDKIRKLAEKTFEINNLNIADDRKEILAKSEMPEVSKPIDERIEKIKNFVAASKFDGSYGKAFAVHNGCINIDAYSGDITKSILDHGKTEVLQAEIQMSYGEYTKLFKFATKELDLPLTPELSDKVIHLELHSFNDR